MSDIFLKFFNFFGQKRFKKRLTGYKIKNKHLRRITPHTKPSIDKSAILPPLRRNCAYLRQRTGIRTL
jgi:hypothetical protein